MAGQKQKIVLEGFSVTIGKLVIEQEMGSPDQAQLAHNVQEALGQALTAPARLLSADTDPRTIDAVEQPAAAVSPSPRKRRRRAASKPPEATSNGEKPSRTKAGSPRPLVDELKTQGFFAQDRGIGEVREELHTRGHSFKSSQLSPVLLAMTRQKALARKKNEKKEWVYRDA